MRPPKRILLIDADPNRQGVTRFLLWVYGRFVISARNLSEADRLAENIDLVLAYDIVDDMRLAELAAACNVRSLLIVKDDREHAYSHVMANPSTFELLETMKALMARKRGPKPRKPVKFDVARVGREAIAA